jgi:hypothetical protein
MTTLGLDYATKPDLRAAWNAGYRYLVRYLAPADAKYDWKRVTSAERDEAWSIGFAMLLVWESYATRALEGTAAGMADARDAASQATALGYPPDVPIFFACDTDASADAARPYFRGVASVRPCAGAYGGIRVVDPVLSEGTVRYGWQACAWSAGKVSQVAHLYQRLRPTTTLKGSFDEDVTLRSIPMWSAPQIRPQPQPVQTAAPHLEDSSMPYMIRTPDGEIDLILAGRLIHLDGPGYDFYAAQKVPLFNVRPQDGAAARS